MSTTIMAPLANNNHKQYLCLFHLITAGLLDENIGSDEQEIIEMIYLIIDIDRKQVRRFHWYSDRYFHQFFRLWVYIDNMFDLYIHMF
jgi:hypothetical protein